jgi:hypothetical protein
MAFSDFLNNVSGVLSDVGNVVDQGSGVVKDVTDTIQNAISLTGFDPTDVGGEIGGVPPVSTGPISAPSVKTSPTSTGSMDKRFLVIGALVIGFLLLRK